MRWQIELLFKRWKGLGGLQVSTKMKPGRVLCELYAKLLGMLVAHWFTFIRGGPLEGFSLTKAIRKIQQLAGRLVDALCWPERLCDTRCRHRRPDPPHPQTTTTAKTALNTSTPFPTKT